MPTTTHKPTRQQERRGWVALVEELMGQIEAWASARQWPAHRQTKTITEPPLGRYDVPILTILTPAGTLRVDPVGRHVVGADGRVDLLAFPSMQRLMVVRHNGQWVLETDSGIQWPRSWGERTFADAALKVTA